MRNCWLDQANEKNRKREKQITTARREMGDRFDEDTFVEILNVLEEKMENLAAEVLPPDPHTYPYPYALWNIKNK